MNWHKPILTDSGGFQIMSLSKFRKIDKEKGAIFQSHLDGKKIELSPEKSIQIQKINPVILWKPTLAWIQRFTDRVIFHINSWKFYPNPVKFYTSTANEARDKFYVWFRPSHNQIRLG